MRAWLALGILLGGCYQPDFSQKPCSTQAGCPDGYLCAAGRCRMGSGDPAKPNPPEIALAGGMVLIGNDIAELGLSPQPLHMVMLRPYFLDVHEVSTADYRACVVSGNCTEPDQGPECNYGNTERQAHPINCVDLNQAETFCKYLGRRLPTEEEWEHAARGPMNHAYPWGPDKPTRAMDPQRLCWYRDNKGTCPVQLYAATGAGFYDLAGNVWEWTSSKACTYDGKTCQMPPAYIVRGGGFRDTDERLMQAWVRLSNQEKDRHSNRGFRCARSGS